MPPAISDEETSDAEDKSVTPPRTGRAKKAAQYKEPGPLELDEDEDVVDNKHASNVKAEDAGEDEEEGEDGEEPEEYIVEKILSHRFEKGAIKYEVKWEGYEKKADRTWEPEENLTENAQSCLDEYFERVGGKDKIMAEIQNGLKNKKRSRPQSNTPTSTSKRSRKNGDHPGESSPPATAKAVQWKPPAGSWEDQILELDACEDEEAGKLMVYLTWKNGARTQHETSVIYKRCPQKMLEFYERHVRIIKKDADNVADEAVM